MKNKTSNSQGRERVSFLLLFFSALLAQIASTNVIWKVNVKQAQFLNSKKSSSAQRQKQKIPISCSFSVDRGCLFYGTHKKTERSCEVTLSTGNSSGSLELVLRCWQNKRLSLCWFLCIVSRGIRWYIVQPPGSGCQTSHSFISQ